MNSHTLFTSVNNYYANLVTQLATAQSEISMSFFAFEDGKWAQEIIKVLRAKADAGVRVRLMVDELGQLSDEPRRIHRNFEIINAMRDLGIQVDVFRPVSPLSFGNRLHSKFAAIDQRTAFLGGSNIGDYYTNWSDTNLRVEGDLGNSFHIMYDLIKGYSKDSDLTTRSLNLQKFQAGNEPLRLTIPRYSSDIREGFMELIRSANKSVFIRTWYFLPDKEMLDLLCKQAQQGIQINVLLSDKTRVRPVDFANHLHNHKLVCAGGNVYRYTGKYMHSKAMWNDKGAVLFGSANMDPTSMYNNFESCLEIQDTKLAWELRRDFYADLANSIKQTPATHSQRTVAEKTLSHVCNLASPWL